MEILIDIEDENLQQVKKPEITTSSEAGVKQLMPLSSTSSAFRRQPIITPILISKTNFLEIEKLNILGLVGEEDKNIVEENDGRENSPMHQQVKKLTSNIIPRPQKTA